MKYKKMVNWLICLFLVFNICAFSVTDQEVQNIQNAIPDKPTVRPVKQRTMLVFSLCNGYKHASIPYWEKALDVMGEKTGAFKVVHSKNMDVFTESTLKQYDVICFNNTTGLVPNKAQQTTIMDFVKRGKGIVGIHAATDNFYEWLEGATMMGGVFKGHPWNAGGTWRIKIDDPSHPLMKPFEGKGFMINDEIYRTLPPQYSRENQRVLMSLDMSDPATKNAEGVTPEDMDTGISWIKPVGNGRLFYCSFGHNNHLTWNRPVLEHFLAGIQYAMGDLKADDSPIKAAPKKLDVSMLDSLIGQVKQYDWDKNRTSLVQLHSLIQEQCKNKDTLKTVESKILSALESGATLAVVDFFCKELAVIGTEQSAPLLSKMLLNPDTSDQARYALERISGDAVDAALLSQLAETKNKTIQIGIITSLGVRRSETAVNRLVDLGKDQDEKVATAAIRALGFIGTEKSANALKSIAKDNLKEHVWDALLSCAGSLSRSGQKNAARNIYLNLYSKDNPSLVQIGALNGLVQIDADEIEIILPAAIQSNDPVLQAAAIGAIAEIDDLRLLRIAASRLMILSDTAKTQLCAALTANEKKIGKKQIERLTGSKNRCVRIAAYQALGKLGDVDTIEPLAEAAANAKERDERKVAREALYQIPGKAIDDAILHKIAAEESEKVVIELVRAAIHRQIAEAPEVLFQTAMSENQRIAAESIRALQSLAGPEYMEEMIKLLIARPGRGTEDALVVAAEKIPNRNNRADMILNKYSTVTGNENAQVSMLRVIGKLGDTDAVSLLRKEHTSSNAKVSEAAFRAMTDWPGNDFIKEMKYLAENKKDTKTKILAFRAYNRMQAADSGKSDSEVVDELIAAYQMAERPDEQRMVVGVLGGFGSIKTLTFVQKVLENPQFKAEAEVSLVSICEKLAKRDPFAVKSTVQEIKTTTENQSVKKRAQVILDKMKEQEGFVLDWQVSGPYTVKGKDGNVLFNHMFGPEKKTNAEQWKSSQILARSDQLWHFDLNKLGKGDNRVAYLKTTLIVAKIADAVLEIGSDDGVKVWLNGKLVHANNASRAVKPGEDKVKVKLNKGENTVLAKVNQKAGNWGFCMKVVGTDGKPLSGLKVQSK